MWKYTVRRILEVVPLIVLISVTCFALMHAIPGGPAGVLADNPKVSPDEVAGIRTSFGLDQPLPVQYVMWCKRVLLHGDFGYSFATGEPVLRMILRSLPATLELMVSAFIIAFLVATSIAVVSALWPRSAVDTFLTVTSLVLISVPIFWSGLMAMMLFSVKWGFLPSAGMFTVGSPASVIDHLRHLILPSAILSLVFIASWSRYLRVTLNEVLSSDFIKVAKAKGLSKTAIVLRHGLRNAAAPVLTVIALNLPLLFTGSVIVEKLFSWPGMGLLFYKGLGRMDYSVLMAIVFVSSVLILVLNLTVDLIYGVLDPRIKYSRS
ncbi:MAG: ABC transporter permease [Candidatus Krumholzibacteria bacterium]|nr:ABC transporter permease [Candidatus Krumholzibacteria bacterium]